MRLIGRIQEQNTFRHCLESTESRLIAVYGRRRVGKTFLVRRYFSNKIKFEVAGLYDGSMTDQLEHFANSLVKHGWVGASLQVPNSWKAAFGMLENYLGSLEK